jgi:hypothetical protein
MNINFDRMEIRILKNKKEKVTLRTSGIWHTRAFSNNLNMKCSFEKVLEIDIRIVRDLLEIVSIRDMGLIVMKKIRIIHCR